MKIVMGEFFEVSKPEPSDNQAVFLFAKAIYAQPGFSLFTFLIYLFLLVG